MIKRMRVVKGEPVRVKVLVCINDGSDPSRDRKVSWRSEWIATIEDPMIAELTTLDSKSCEGRQLRKYAQTQSIR